MAITRKYKSGAVIYFENDTSDDIYVLKSGEITLTYRGIETLAHVTERLKEGDFFGVKSSLGRYKREETARVVVDSTILVLTIKEFENLAKKNIRLVLKMLTIFSTQLRKIGKQATNILSTSGEPITPSLALLKIGEYYLKNKKFEQATYAFSKYIEHYPTGEYVEQTKERILLAQKGISTGIQSIAESEPAELSSDDSGHFSLPDEAEVLDDTENNHLNDAGLSDDNEIISSEELFDSATSLIENKQFEQAIEKLTPIIAQENSSEDQVLKTKAAFEISRCYFELEQYKESIGRFTNFIKENPKTDLMKSALFYIGKSQQAFGNIEKAIGFYKKVAGLPPHESINDEAKELLKELS